jgi:hypothetical protein
MKTTTRFIIGCSLAIMLSCSSSYPASAQESPGTAAFKRLDKNGDGKIRRDEAPSAHSFRAADADQNGSVSPDEFRRFLTNRNRPAPEGATPTTPATTTPQPVNGVPALKQLPDSDAVRDAAGTGQLFECIHVPGITDVREGMNGFALVDLNRDGRPDLIATYSPPASHRTTRLVVLLNEGGFHFVPHAITIRDSTLTMDEFGPAAQIPNLADFNGDGFLDLVVTRSAPMLGGTVRGGIKPLGVTFLLSDGDWDKFVDVSERMGARNELGYNRQTSFGDVNGDGWLDIAIGCDNIKNGLGGFPHSRLYVFKPNGSSHSPSAVANESDRSSSAGWADGTRSMPATLGGRFVDIGGTDLVPDFGGFYHDSAKDKAGPGISLRDLDNDGDLDLVQSYHVDVRQPLLPYWPGEYRQGVMCWKNLLRETGELRFEKITDNGLHCEARLQYNREQQLYEPASEARAPGLPYISLADVDADGLQDILAIGPDSDYWAPRVEHVTGRFWRNLGGFRFQDRTAEAGFAPLNNTYGEWMAFFEEPEPARFKNWKPRISYESQPGKTPEHPAKQFPYYADSVFADFDNDGWLDVVVMNRSESTTARSMLFMGRGNGTFEVKPTTFSGLDSSGISAEAADLNGDGLLDLVFAADPDNSSGGREVTLDRYESKVYWNTGEHGAKENHWLHLTFTGLKDAELIGARVELLECGDLSSLSLSPDSASKSASTDPLGGSSPREIQSGDKSPHSKKQYRWIHSNHSYKSGGALNAHFGLGKTTSADVKVTLLDGRTKTFSGLAASKTHELRLAQP